MENFSIEDTYKSILTDLKNNKRPRLKLSQTDAQTCIMFWHQCLESNKPQDLTPLLCVLDHSDHHSRELSDLYTTTIANHPQDTALLIYLISGSIKHVIEWHGKKGDRAPMPYLNALKTTLNHDDLEVVEWSLRAAESLGMQIMLLKEDILAAKPSVFKIFNTHYKNISELIKFLSKRWERPAP